MGAYFLDVSDVYRPYGLTVLTFRGDKIDEIRTFRDPMVPERFGLPAQM